MEFIVFLLFFILIMLILGFIIVTIVLKSKSKKVKKRIEKISNEDQLIAIDDLRRLLRSDPDNFQAREKLAELLVETKSYVLAIKEYLILLDNSASNPEMNELIYTIKVADTFYNLENFEDAKKYYLIAKKMDDLNFEVNLYLGKIELKYKNYDKAFLFLNASINMEPDNIEAQKTIGICFFYLNKFKESYEYFIKIFQVDQKDQIVLYYLSYCFLNLGKNDEALKCFTKLLGYPEYVAESLEMIGYIHKKLKMYIQAIEDYEKLLTNNLIKGDKLLDIYYSLAECCINIHNIPKAINYLQKIENSNSNFKNVKEMLATYSQLNTNSMLEKYLIGSMNQFTNICKIFVKFYVAKYSNLKGNVKFLTITMNKDNTLEMYVEVSSRNFVEEIYFNFMRSSTSVGDLIVRNIYNKLREQKIDKGICVTAGSFSETAKQFVESRMIELVEKNQLSDILSEISTMFKEN